MHSKCLKQSIYISCSMIGRNWSQRWQQIYWGPFPVVATHTKYICSPSFGLKHSPNGRMDVKSQTPSLVSSSTWSNMLNYLHYSHKCSNGNGILIKSLTSRFTAKSLITANSEEIQRLQWNMDNGLPPCEMIACSSLFPRLFLDVLWLWASVIMPRSWLLDGFSTIRPHYSLLGLSCLSLHPSQHAHAHTNPCSTWTDGQSHMHSQTHTHNTQKHKYSSPCHPRQTQPFHAKWQIAVAECS